MGSKRKNKLSENTLSNFDNFLFIGAHPDDIVISCGGMIQRLLKHGKTVIALCLTGFRNKVRSNEYIKGMRLLSVNDWSIFEFNDKEIKLKEILPCIEKFISSYEINTIFTHWHGCVHQDHRVVSEASRIAARKGNVNLIYYEDYRHKLSQFAWKPNTFFTMTEEELDKKRKALYCHESQKGTWMEKVLRDNVERFEIGYLSL
nr:MAG: LmbE-like deacetylase [Lokiarchaeota virus Ratatoskr Meg22_1012]